MTCTPCPRLFEVEALRDGRLAGNERQNFERHLVGCPVCAREAAALDAIAHSLRSGAVEVDELHVRRERTRLLAAFDQILLERRGPRLERRGLMALGLSLALLAALVVFWRWPQPAAPAATPHATVIRAGAATRWSRSTRADRDLVVLEHGKLHIRVQRAAGAPGLTVVLPDGELEDIGTTFSVEVAEGRTRRVHVEDGSVLLELDAHPRVTLRAGQIWSAPPLPAAEAAEVPEPIRPPLSPAPTPPAAVAASAASPSTSPPPSLQQSQAASSDFRVAMAALHAGDAKSAAAKFQRFVAQYPSDPRAEDAAYLRVLALDRAGDVAGRQAAARAYLGSYPTGFRRAEVERLAP